MAHSFELPAKKGTSFYMIGKNGLYVDYHTKRFMMAELAKVGITITKQGTVYHNDQKIGVWMHNPGNPWHVYISL